MKTKKTIWGVILILVLLPIVWPIASTFFDLRLVRYEVKSIHYLSKASSASVRGEKIDLAPYKDALLGATWVNRTVLNKGNYVFKVDGGSDVHLSFYGHFFWVDDRPGCYLVQPDQHDEFDQLMKEIMEKLK